MKTKLLPVAVLLLLAVGMVATVGYATGAVGGGGMMGRGQHAMMGTGGRSTAWYLDGSGPVRTVAEARTQAQKFADRLGLKTAEVMQFSNNFYARLDDKSGHAATEVLVDPASGDVTLEYGPAMMWNTRYGMMNGARVSSGGMMSGSGSAGMISGPSSGGMMGGGMMSGSNASGMMGGGMMGRYGGGPNWTPPSGNVTTPVSAAEAQKLGNQWLASRGEAQTAGAPDQLPGYFTMETLKGGKVDGMLSVNEATGAVFYHWWHGSFVAAEE